LLYLGNALILDLRIVRRTLKRDEGVSKEMDGGGERKQSGSERKSAVLIFCFERG